MGGATEQVPNQPRPAAVLQTSILPIAHDVEVKGEAHVLRQLLQEVDAVSIATLLVVLGDRHVWSSQVVEKLLQDRGLVGERVQAQLSRGTQAVPVHLPGEHEGVFHQRHHAHVQPRRSAPLAPGAGTPGTRPRPPLHQQFPSAPASHAGPRRLSQRVQLEGPDVVMSLRHQSSTAGACGHEAAAAVKGRVGQKPEEEEDKEEDGGQDGQQTRDREKHSIRRVWKASP